MSVARFGQAKALIATRFDRKLHPSRKYWLRLPQEDFCQATATRAASTASPSSGDDDWLAAQGFDLSLSQSLVKILAILSPLLASLTQNIAEIGALLP